MVRPDNTTRKARARRYKRIVLWSIAIILVGAMVLAVDLGLLLAGCSGNAGDSGADRSQQQSKELRARISTTQIDR